MPVKTGLDVLTASGFRVVRGERVGLLVHAASVDRNLVHAIDLFLEAGVNLIRLFGPQHGLTGHTQDNMIEWTGYQDAATGIPVCSLYGAHRKPTPDMLAGLDTLVIDLQDVGARYYTFIWTMLGCMEACAQAGIRVLVLDRPNPINAAQREGPILDPAFRSFVGMAPIPVLHGMIIGELAKFFGKTQTIHGQVDVVWMEDYARHLWFDQTQLPWVMPSPNMPSLDTATVYPGACLLEGTNLSEGRGTTRPFEILGAPFVDSTALKDDLDRLELPGVVFRPLAFQPTFQKWADQLCAGIQIHIIDRERFQPFACMIAVLSVCISRYPDQFAWGQPPYEYEDRLLPFDILAGSDIVRQQLLERVPLADMQADWAMQVSQFNTEVESDLHYA